MSSTAFRHQCVSILVAVIASTLLLVAGVQAQSCDGVQFYDFSLLAGPSTGPGYADGNGSNVKFNTPNGVAVDNDVIYIADSLNHVIRKVTLSGDVTVFAGVPGTPGSNDGPALSARFNDPRGIAVDVLGVVYVADYGNHTIRKIDPEGNVTTAAGAAGIAAEQDGHSTNARFNGPLGLLADEAGNVVVTDVLGHTIRVIQESGEVITVGGTPNSPGYADGPIASSRFNSPRGLTLDDNGNVWIADTGNHVIRVVSLDDGEVVTAAGQAGTPGYQDGVGTVVKFNTPTDIVNGSQGLFVVDSGNYVIRAITLDDDGIPNVVRLAGTPGVRGYLDTDGLQARFDHPIGIAIDQFGGVIISEAIAGTIRRLGITNVAATLAGSRRVSGTTDGAGSSALFDLPDGAVLDTAGNLYVSDRDNHTVRKIATDGTVTTYAGVAGQSGSLDGAPGIGRLKNPTGLDIDSSGNIYVADSGNHAIRRVSTNGTLSTYAGSLGTAGADDGPKATARFRNPEDVALDSQGNVWVADLGNRVVRMVSSTTVSTPAGSAGSSGTTDGAGASARFRSPAGIAVAPNGSIYIADSEAHTIRRYSSGSVTTVAGAAGQAGTAGGAAASARFNEPSGLTVDASGNVFIADRKNMALRRLSASGFVTTVGGQVALGGTADGLGPISKFSQPVDVVLNASGEPYVISTGNGVVHKGAVVTPLCLESSRFALALTAKDPRTGNEGLGLAIPQNDVFGYFSIPGLTQNPDNPEVFAKLLNGTGFNGNYWVFYGGLTDFEFNLVVVDTMGGSTKTYNKPGGSFCGGADTSAFAGKGGFTSSKVVPMELTSFELPAAVIDSPEADCGVTELCLFSNRFAFKLDAKDPRTQATGAGLPIPQTDLFGYFSIPALTQNPSNPEVFVKLLDGRPVNGKFWVFYGGLTDFEFTLTVTDTLQIDQVNEYKKPGLSFCGGADTSAF